MPPREDVSIRLRRRRAMLAPFVPLAVHLAAEVDNGLGEPVLDQQLSKVIEVRVVVARRRRNETRAGCLEVARRSGVFAHIQEGFYLGICRSDLRLAGRR